MRSVACVDCLFKVFGLLLSISGATYEGDVGAPDWHYYPLTEARDSVGLPCDAENLNFTSREDDIKLVADPSQRRASVISRVLSQSIRLHAFRLDAHLDTFDINDRFPYGEIDFEKYGRVLGYIVSPDFKRQSEDPDINLPFITDLLKDHLPREEIMAFFRVRVDVVYYGESGDWVNCSSMPSGCPGRIFLLRPEEYCELTLKECRYTNRPVSEWFFTHCMESLGWSIFAGEFAPAPQQCSQTCPAVKYGSGNRLSAESPTAAGQAWADLVKLRDRYFNPWGKVSYEDVQTCDELAFAFYRSANDVSQLSNPEMFLQSAIIGYEADVGFMQQRALDCRRMHEWLNCNCGLCHSWQVLCGCSLSQVENAAPTCLDASGTPRAAILESEECTVGCRANFSSHISKPLKCLNRQFVTEVMSSGRLARDDVAVLATEVCYNSTPEVFAGSLSFADEDPRRDFLGGALSLDVPDASKSHNIAGFSLYWGSSSTSKLGGRIAVVPKLEARYVLPPVPLPATASHLLAFPQNARGETSVPLAVAVWDLHVENSIAGSSLRGSSIGDRLSLEVFGHRSTGDGEWYLRVGSRECGMASECIPLPAPDVARGGSQDVWRFGWNISISAPGFHVLCQRAPGISVLIANAIWWVGNVTVTLTYKKLSWIAGQEESVNVQTNSVFTTASWLALVPVGTPFVDQKCGAGGNTLVGQRVHEISQQDAKSQQWVARPTAPGKYQLCWASCFVWFGGACQSVIQLVEVKESSCSGNQLGSTVAAPSECGRRSYTDVTSVALERGASFPRCKDDLRTYDPISVDVAPDGSYMLAAVPCLGAVLRLDLQQPSSVPVTVLPISGDNQPCNYFPSDAIPRSPLCAGNDTSKVSFMYPVSVRIAPSNEFWLVVDAYAHRVLRIDLDLNIADRPPLRVYTVAGSGAAVAIPGVPSYANRAPRNGRTEQRYMLSCSNFTVGPCPVVIEILEGTFMGDGGPAERAHLNLPWDVAFLPGDSGTFLVADRMNHRIRKVSGAIISTVAGIGPPPYCSSDDGCPGSDGDGGSATTAQLREPVAVTALPGNLGTMAIAERGRGANRVRWVDECGTIRTLFPANAFSSAPWQLRLGPSEKDVLFLQSQNGALAPWAYRLPVHPNMDANKVCSAENFISEDGRRYASDLIRFPVGLATSNGSIYFLDVLMEKVYIVGDFVHECLNDRLVFDRDLRRCRCKNGWHPHRTLLGQCMPAPADHYYNEAVGCSLGPAGYDANSSDAGSVPCQCPSGMTTWQMCTKDVFARSRSRALDKSIYVMYDLQVLVQGFFPQFALNGIYFNTEDRLDRPARFRQHGPNTSGTIFWEDGSWFIGPDWSVESAWASKDNVNNTVEALLEEGAWASMHDVAGNVTVLKPDLHVMGLNTDASGADGAYFSVGIHPDPALRYIKIGPGPEMHISWDGAWFIGYASNPDHALASKIGEDNVNALISPGAWQLQPSQEMVATSVQIAEIELPPRLLKETICLGAQQSESIDNCTCKNGYALVRKCTACVKGWLCPANFQPELSGICGAAGLRGSVRVDNGFWGVENTSGAGPGAYECADDAHCWWWTYVDLWNMSSQHACDRVSPGEVIHCSAQSGLLGQCLGGGCQHNRAGFACGRCKDGYFQDVDDTCVPCSDTGSLIVILLLKLIFQLVALTLFYTFLNNPKGGKFMASYMLSTAAASFAEFLQQYNFLRAIGLALPLTILDTLIRLLLRLSFSWVPLACIWNNLYETRFPTRVSWPFQLASTFLLLWALTKVTAPFRRRLPEHPHRAWGVIRPTVKAAYAEIRNFKLERDKVLNTFLFIIAAMYMNIVRASFALFQAEERSPVPSPAFDSTSQGSKFTLLEYPDMIWFHDSHVDSEWLLMLPFGILAMLLTVVIFLYHLGVTYYAPRGFATNAPFRNRQKYFYAKYREDRYYWGMISMTKGLLLNLMLFVHSSAKQSSIEFVTPLLLGLAIFAINFVLAILLCVLSPYKVSLNGHLDAILHMLTLCIMAGHIEKQGGTEMQERDLVPLVAAGGFFWLLPALVLTARLLYGVVLRSRYDRQQHDASQKLAAAVLILASRLRHLRSATILKLFSGISPAERLHLLKGIDVLDGALGIASKEKPSDTSQGQAPRRVMSGISKISKVLLRRRGATKGSKAGSSSADVGQGAAHISAVSPKSGGLELASRDKEAPGSTQEPGPVEVTDTKRGSAEADATPSEGAMSTKAPVPADARAATPRPGPPRLMGSAKEAADAADGQPEPCAGEGGVATVAPAEAQDDTANTRSAQPRQAAGCCPAGQRFLPRPAYVSAS